MKPYFYSLDDFFPWGEFNILRDYAHIAKYEDHKAPFDGVVYKNVAPAPMAIVERLTHILTWIMGRRIVPMHTCFRLSVEGSEPPQWAHSDREVAEYGFFMFVNEGPGGTALLQHAESGMWMHPRNQYELDLWKRDYNNEGAWYLKAMVDCAPNRAILLRSELIHAAIPRGGFGGSPIDGRLILLCFFD
jgi:hypothetical protein